MQPGELEGVCYRFGLGLGGFEGWGVEGGGQSPGWGGGQRLIFTSFRVRG